jgi:hypothetical protein
MPVQKKKQKILNAARLLFFHLHPSILPHPSLPPLEYNNNKNEK